MKRNVMRKGTVQARIAAFESTAKVPKVKKNQSFSSSGQVSKMISFFETKKAGERPVIQLSPQVSTKVVKLASVFGPAFGFGDNEKGGGDNSSIPEDGSEMSNEDLKTHFSLLTNKSAQPSSPQGGGQSDSVETSRANDGVETLDNTTRTKIPATKQDRKSRTQEFRKKEEEINGTSLCVEPETVKRMGFRNEKSAMKTFAEIFAENPKAPLAEGAYKPVVPSRGLTERRAVDEIQSTTNNYGEHGKRNRGKKTITSKKAQANTGRKKPLKIRRKDKNAKSPASRKTTPSTEARSGRKKVYRRSRNERNSGVKKMLRRGLRALKQKLSRQAVSTETLESNQSAVQGTTCMITIKSASSINVSWKT